MPTYHPLLVILVRFVLPALIGLSMPYAITFFQIRYYSVRIYFMQRKNRQLVQKICANHAEITRRRAELGLPPPDNPLT